MSTTITSSAPTSFYYLPSRIQTATLIIQLADAGDSAALLRVNHTGDHKDDVHALYIDINFLVDINKRDVWYQSGQRYANEGTAKKITWCIGQISRYFTAELRIPISYKKDSVDIDVYSGNLPIVFTTQPIQSS